MWAEGMGGEHLPKGVTDERAAIYGHPRDNFKTIAGLWTVILHRLGANYEFRQTDVALFMAAVKLAREANQHEPDNLTDLAGYARCAQMILGEAD